MKNVGKDLSRRSFLKGTSAGAAIVGLAPTLSLAQTMTAPPCHVGFDLASYTVQDKPVLTQANPGAMTTVAAEHAISINYYTLASYVVGQTTTETRSILCVDVGANPAAGTYHPVEWSGITNRDTITDIYVFSQADNSLLFWKKMASQDTAPAAMFILPPALVQAKPKITVVARCAAHGYWGADFDLGRAPADYTTAVGTYNASQVFGGSTVLRPYAAPAATGGQGDLTPLHRPNIIVSADNQVQVFLGGPLDGSAKHPRYASNHYVMGGMLFDQDGNVLNREQIILYSDAGNNLITFTGFSLAGQKVKTLRAVMFDTLQGRVMSFLDV